MYNSEKISAKHGRETPVTCFTVRHVFFPRKLEFLSSAFRESTVATVTRDIGLNMFPERSLSY